MREHGQREAPGAYPCEELAGGLGCRYWNGDGHGVWLLVCVVMVGERNGPGLGVVLPAGMKIRLPRRKLHVCSGKLSMYAVSTGPDHGRLFAIAESQDGYFTMAQAQEAGFGSNTHRYHVRS